MGKTMMRDLLTLITGLVLIVPELLAGGSAPGKTLDATHDKAIKAGLSPLKAPFHRPLEYVGMSVAEAAKATGGSPNNVRNIIIESDLADMLLETVGNSIRASCPARAKFYAKTVILHA